MFFFICECDVNVYMGVVMFWKPNFFYVESGVYAYNIVAIFIDKITSGTYSHRSWERVEVGDLSDDFV